MPRRIGIPLTDWPAPDRKAWERALAAGDVFADSGIAARWRPATRKDAINGYGYWLRFLIDEDRDLLDLDPGVRATPDRLRAYLKMLLSRITDMSAAAALGHLVLALRAIAPGYDVAHLRALQYATQRRARPRDKRARLVSSERLVGLGLELMTRSELDNEIRDPRTFRDGLIIALLATRPMRLSNLASLEIDRHVEIDGENVVLKMTGDEMKNGRPIEFWLPRDLVAPFNRYLREVRPRFHCAGQHAGLWPSHRRQPLTASGIHQIVVRRTQAAFGFAVNPHLFRDNAATTLARVRPEQALLARDLLGHARFETTEQHYLHAKTAEAGRAYAGQIEALRRGRKTRPGL